MKLPSSDRLSSLFFLSRVFCQPSIDVILPMIAVQKDIVLYENDRPKLTLGHNLCRHLPDQPLEGMGEMRPDHNNLFVLDPLKRYLDVAGLIVSIEES